MALATRGYTTRLGWCNRRLALCFLKQYNATPSGHSTTAVMRNATTPNVGPTILHLHGFWRVPHCTHNGIAISTLAPAQTPQHYTSRLIEHTTAPPCLAQVTAVVSNL
ncbi:hypothetical protein KC19_11G083600 [Ceratodon purpureus]|uniref:Uncharacterized protein n=1 Tax=Ceratodon purpureus TaxID=3225 RepID=A0A8T0GDT1_CERPU|nr:hypothetical protein KC19_11G083600 [Ceratodon purpureus]